MWTVFTVILLLWLFCTDKSVCPRRRILPQLLFLMVSTIFSSVKGFSWGNFSSFEVRIKRQRVSYAYKLQSVLMIIL